MLRISRSIGSHARLVGILFGATLGLLTFVSGIGIAVQSSINVIDEGHTQHLQQMRNSQSAMSKLLDELHSQHSTVCNDDNLNHLRGLLFKHRQFMAIGLLDGQGRLFCTTGAGLLPAPLVHDGPAIDGTVGRYFLNTPTNRFNPRVEATSTSTVVRRGRFELVLEEHPRRGSNIAHVDTLWAGSTAQRRMVYRRDDSRGRATDAVVAADTPHLKFDWKQRVLLVTNTVPGPSPVSAQTVLTVGDVIPQPLLFAGFVALCLFLGWLSSSVIRNRCRYLNTIDFRIRHLCVARNIVCHYQPVVDLPSGRVIGCEVLARLQDGDTLLYPDQFIPALIKQKLTWTFDALVTAQAIQELSRSLPDQSEAFSVALNFFPQNLCRSILHPHLQQALQQTERTDLHLHLEVTEYDFSEHLVPELRQLQADGYAISIDDFGTGYSNLGAVKHIAPDYLKIDKSFVFEMEDTSIRSTLIPEIIAIGKAISSEIIAEGIENQAQLLRLRALGVQYGQGYYFSRPVPLAEFMALLRADQDALALA
nr:EAL domain-containing protein [uncultured Rhodoferax sp.]